MLLERRELIFIFASTTSHTQTLVAIAAAII
jgi:hypothetical protein